MSIQYLKSIKKFKAFIVLYGLICAAEYYYFMTYQLPGISDEQNGNIEYSTSAFRKLKEIVLDLFLQEMGTIGIALSSAVLTMILFILWASFRFALKIIFNHQK